jgi:hypothetical protein
VTVTIDVLPSVAAPPAAPALPTPMALAVTTAFSSSGTAQPDDADADAQYAADAAAPADEPADPLDLLAVADPILLPGFTLPGDEVATLMLPAAPEMAYLSDALAKIVQRLTERTPSHITFVDPVTGYAEGDDAAAILKQAGQQPWLQVDTNEAARPSRISWETA